MVFILIFVLKETINNLNTGKAVTSKERGKQAVNARTKQQQQQQANQSQQMLNSNTTPSSSSSLQPTISTSALARKNSNKFK